MLFGFAWSDEATAWSAPMHREDEQLFAFELVHEEGAAATLKVSMANSGSVGFLAAGRSQWCWLSWDPGTGPIPIFHGRLIGIPENLHRQIVDVEFIARPSDYASQKDALAASMRVLPWWDPVWLQDKIDKPDTVLEAYAKRWHVGRVILAVTASDVANGEDGTIEIQQSEHFYEDVDVSYGSVPLRSVSVIGTVTWEQIGAGDMDLTVPMVRAFQESGSPYEYPIVASFTGEGLLSTWPEPLESLGGGWSMGSEALVEPALYQQAGFYSVSYLDLENDPEPPFRPTFTGGNTLFSGTPANSVRINDFTSVFFVQQFDWDVDFVITPLNIRFPVHYDARRDRTEIVTFTLSAAVQPILVDPDGDDHDTIDLSSDYVGQEIDDGGSNGFQAPLRDARRNSYFPTDRGQLSLQFLILLARARLRSRARCVMVKCRTTWEKIAATISCRHNVLLHDYRLPGAQASGKVISYRLAHAGKGDKMVAELTIGCSVGYGVVLPAAAAGDDCYADNYSVGYTQKDPGTSEVAVIAGEVKYTAFDGLYVVDDDGVDLFNMTPERAVISLVVEKGVNEQRVAIDQGVTLREPIAKLQETYTEVDLQLVPVEGGAFTTTYPVTVSELVIPKTVDLEAA